MREIHIGSETVHATIGDYHYSRRHVTGSGVATDESVLLDSLSITEAIHVII